jgi:hypothetical protein
MKHSARTRSLWCLLFLLASVVVTALPTATQAETIQYSIVADAQIDSRDPDDNFGSESSAKVVVNGMDGSLARAVIQFPTEVWNTPGTLVSAKIGFYVWADQTGDRNVRLHPLTQAFVESEVTWNSYDGTNSWTTPGGDYDANVYVDAVEPENGFGWFTWDITSLWDNANLRNIGAILKMGDESDPGYPNMPRAALTAHESDSYPHPYVEVITIAEPGTLAMLLAGSVLAVGTVLRRRRRRSATVF